MKLSSEARILVSAVMVAGVLMTPSIHGGASAAETHPPQASAGDARHQGTEGDAQMLADARRTQRAVAAAYNGKRWDALRPLYVDDAIMLPPNHEPIRGRDSIIEFLRSVRDVFGEIDISGSESAQVRVSGKLASFVYEFTAQSGRLRMMSNELYERQSDGSVRLTIDEPSFIDPFG